MNSHHSWKFTLSIVTFCLAFVVVGQGQTPIDGSCGPQECAVNCGSANASTCTITIGNNGGITLSNGSTDVSTACVMPGATVQWQVASGTPADYIVEFAPGSSKNPFGMSTTPLLTGAQNTPAQGGQLQTAVPGTCWEYSVAYCGGGNNCVAADPKVVVSCNNCPKPSAKPQK
jgi:hypothetical protein